MMTATTAVRIDHEPLDETRRLLMRLNPSLFHGLAYALLLEAAAPVVGTEVASLTLRNRERRLQVLRGEAAAVWPEFDWHGVERVAAAHGALIIALEHPAVRAAAVWVPFVYGMMARLAPEGRLRRCLQELAGPRADHSALQGFRQLVAGWCALRRLARPLHVAQGVIASGWRASSALPALTCDAAVRRFIAACGPRGLRGALLALAARAALRYDWENHLQSPVVPATRSSVGVASGAAALL